jgi:hypothetical protein
MHFPVADQRKTDSFILNWHYSRLADQLRKEEEALE